MACGFISDSIGESRAVCLNLGLRECAGECLITVEKFLLVDKIDDVRIVPCRLSDSDDFLFLSDCKNALFHFMLINHGSLSMEI